ncbi:C39 family peptidase [Lacrimispora sp.]|uniref:C39 family peptidase n=1 Tax=Lacrimispora sp. TaxID=2719234 RepID=UPI0029E50148|nr:hypothetical protein [Lacrimispora sp.]
MNRLFKTLFKPLFVIVIPFAIFSFNCQIEGSAAATIQASTTTVPQTIDAEIPQEGRYDVMLDSVCGPLTYYNQADARWSNYLWGGRDPLVTYGCGPTVMAMIVTSLTGNQVLPTDMANWAAANNGWCPGQGSYHRLIPDSAAAYGLVSTPIKNYTADGIRNALDSGQLVIALMRKGHFTQQGHFIIITNYNADGTFRIADSNNYDNTKINWDPSVILGELNHRSSSGGPLWAIAPSN